MSTQRNDYASTRSNWTYFACGQLGGMAGVFIGHPLDVVKTRVQTDRTNSYKSASSASKQFYGPIHYRVQRIYQKDGILGFYRGLITPLLAVGFAKSIAFGVYGSVRQLFNNVEHDPNGYYPKEIALSAAAAGVASALVITPVDQMKVAMVLRKSGSQVLQRRKLLGKLQQLAHRHHGLLPGLYYSFSPCVVREVVGYSLYFSSYEFLSQSTTFGKIFPDNTVRKFIAGGLSGVFMWLVYFPIDTVKNRVQANAANFKLASDRAPTIREQSIASKLLRNVSFQGKKKRKLKKEISRRVQHNRRVHYAVPLMSPSEIVLSRYDKRGVKGFYKGVQIAVLRAFPTHACVFTTNALLLNFVDTYLS